ncbi:serine-rich adhesin for platelets-like [Oryza brachyantha]|uniref:Calmodulin-binding domain-containing protein n=1 Tax=Oryza brachyantha TaxID=4533 RepID=J3LLB5_ORYBR|nr:serine-rich adhesin for platelets-like [Oryza brachyantha]XP_006649615.1 serine-rich adhesin for platelets-like [Oryza brachyantha]
MSKVLERRNSFSGSTPTISAADSRKNEKTTPHYLRASKGSCHDLCKYGHKSPEEEKKFSTSGGRRKKLPSHLNNQTLHRSAILDRSKDVRHKNLSLVKSSISLGESECIVPKKTSANLKGSSDHLVPHSSSSADHKNVNLDGRKKHPTFAQKSSADSGSSNGVPKLDKKLAMPNKGTIAPAKLKLAEMPQLEKSRTLEKVRTVKQSSIKRPTSLPTKLNLIKQVPAPSQASSYLLSSKGKRVVKGELTSPSATLTGVRRSNSGKTGRSLMSSSKPSVNGKEALDMSISPFFVDSKMDVSVVIQEDDVQDSFTRCHHVESTLAGVSSHTTECVDESRREPEETTIPVSGDDGMKGDRKNEASGNETPLQGSIIVDLLQSSDNQELKHALNKYDSIHNQGDKNAINSHALEAEDSQTDSVVGNSLSTENSSETEADGVKVNASMETQFAEGNKEEGAHESLQESIEQLVVGGKHAEEPGSFLGSTSGNTVEDIKADEIFEGWTNSSSSHCQPISETSSDGELLVEPKSVQIEPSDSTVQADGLLISSTGDTFEQDELKPVIFLRQSPEELSEDEFYEEYDFVLSESDESCTEDEGAMISKNSEDHLKADGQLPKRTSTLEQDDASDTPYKLKFKRGKIVELEPDSNGPRRLKFRRRSASEVSSNEGQSARRIYRRNSTKDVGPSNLDVESPGVKLRHQDTQEKKDAQGLFNNVIEETASKLVESRKSKVKALVGAFETVILLQDGKPASSTPQAGNSPNTFHDDEGKAPEQAA